MSDSKHTEKHLNGEDNSKKSPFFSSNVSQTVIYQYYCTVCNHVTEQRFPFGNPEPTVECGTEGCNGTAQKIISTPGVLTGIPTHPARKGRGQG